MKRSLIVFCALFSSPLFATSSIMKVTVEPSMGGILNVDPSMDERTLLVDATKGSLTIKLPAIDTLPPGFHIPTIYKTDRSSNPIGFQVTRSGDTLNHFFGVDAPYPLWLNLTQQAAELVCDGGSQCFLMGKSFHHGQPQSQRTVVSSPSLTSYNITPVSEYEVVRVNASGGDIGIYFDKVTNFTMAGYMSARVDFQRVDDSAHKVMIFAHAGDVFEGGATSIPLNGRGHWTCVYVASDSLNICSDYVP